MNDATKLLDWLDAHPGYSWLPLLALLALIMLMYEVLKNLLPNVLKTLASTLKAIPQTRKARLKTERSIRKICIASRNVSWVSSLPALSRFDFNIPLSDVFVAPRLQVSRNGGHSWATSLQEFLSANRLACISGAPGSGKSSLLSITALAFAQENADAALGINEARLPLCFDCKEFPTSEALPPAPELFANLFERRGLKIEANYIHRLLDEGRCAVLLDGLDEVGGAPQRRRLLDWLIGLSAAYSENNRFLITCRDTEWQGAGLPLIARAKVLPFSLKEARAFVNQWRTRLSTSSTGDPSAPAREARFDGLAEELEGEFEFLYTNPMLLTLAMILLTIDVPLPRKRSHILDTFVTSMLGEWQSLKERSARPLEIESTYAAISRLALLCLEQMHNQAFSDDDPLLSTTLGSNEPNQINPREWLERISASSGLLQPLGDGEWTFSNRRIIEFLAARELALHPDKWHEYWEEPAWKEIMMFLPELVLDKRYHMSWVEAQGIPTSDMHALFVLNSAVECKESSAERSGVVLKAVRRYFFEKISTGVVIDEDLARRYMRADSEYFMSQLEQSIQYAAADDDGGVVDARHADVLVAALRAGYSPAARMVCVNLNQLGADVQHKILEELPTYRPMIQVMLLPDLLQLSLDRELLRIFSRCGADVLESLIAIARREDVDRIEEQTLAAIAEFSHPDATAFLVEILSVEHGERIPGTALERNLVVIGSEISAVELEALLGNGEGFYQTFTKRGFDLLLSITALTLMLPILIAISVVVRVTTQQSIFVRTLSVGRKGVIFSRLRFRTIRGDEDLETVVQASRSDARVTRFGGLLRRTSVDELPSMLAIIRGDMAFIGPRPLHPKTLQARYEHGYSLAMEVRKQFRPGLLGLANLEFGQYGSISSERETAQDLYYAANCSLLFDMKLVALSFVRAIFKRSSY